MRKFRFIAPTKTYTSGLHFDDDCDSSYLSRLFTSNVDGIATEHTEICRNTAPFSYFSGSPIRKLFSEEPAKEKKGKELSHPA